MIPTQLAIQKGEWVTVQAFDVQKAFDSTPPDILKRKAEKYGIKGSELTFLNSYMTGRSQIGKVNGTLSEIAPQMIGCPQGGNLSCGAYILFNNDLPRAVTGASVTMYSDDTTCVIKTSTRKHNIDRSNQTLSEVGDWFVNNRLTLNVGKTLYMTFNKNSKAEDLNLPLSIGNTFINRVGQGAATETTKLLGLILDQQLSFRHHYDKVLGKVRAACFALRSIKNLIQHKERLLVYRALVESHMRYCITIWGPKMNKKQTKNLLILQKRAIRNVAGKAHNAHTDPLFRRYKILKFPDLMKRECVIWVFKAKNNILPETVCNLIMEDNTANGRVTRTQTNNKIPRNTKETETLRLMKQEWNSLPSDIRDSEDFESFKQLTLKYYLNRYETVCDRKDCEECTETRAFYEMCKQDTDLANLGISSQGYIN